MFSSIQGDFEQPRGGAVIQDHESRLLCLETESFISERADVYPQKRIGLLVVQSFKV